MGALDLQLAHVLGQRLGELSMAQITELLDVQRALVVRLALMYRLGRGAPLHLYQTLTALALPQTEQPLPSLFAGGIWQVR